MKVNCDGFKIIYPTTKYKKIYQNRKHDVFKTVIRCYLINRNEYLNRFGKLWAITTPNTIKTPYLLNFDTSSSSGKSKLKFNMVLLISLIF